MVELLSVDLQHEFASPGGGLYRPRGCVPFLTELVFPTARARQWRVHEIVSDYRVPAKPSTQWHCGPGRWAGESLVPRDLLASEPWIKATPSPAWTRSGAGDEHAEPGPAEPDPNGFAEWLIQAIGRPDPERTVVVVGLMLGVCVLSTLQELTFRGYRPSVLVEGVDTHSGDEVEKQQLMNSLFPFWGTPVHWQQLNAS